ncbi:Pancreatic lipase-related protein 2 [Halotydeus destructor]|nr:Pancreatic lipase-related protein 2 [Halotydeus destructor]
MIYCGEIFTFLYLIHICLATVFKDGPFIVNVEEQQEIARRINQFTDWKPGCKCKCDEHKFQCTCFKNGQQVGSSAIPTYMMTSALSEVIDHPEKLTQRQEESPYPVNLASVHSLLGVAEVDEPPFSLTSQPFVPVDEIDTKFLLSDYRDKNAVINIHYQDEKIIKSLPSYDQVFIISHGFLSFPETHSGHRDRILSLKRFQKQAVILVDWRRGATPSLCDGYFIPYICQYDMAVTTTGIVGREVGILAHYLVANKKVTADNVHLIGFSLGAQISHYGANWFTKLQLRKEDNCQVVKVGRITGLDPAAPKFQPVPGSYLSKDDAHFVDVVHTSSVENDGQFNDMVSGRFGMSMNVGHVDVYLNGGRVQPTCGGIACHHQRAYQTHELALDENLDVNQLFAVKCDCYERTESCFQSYSDMEDDITVLGLGSIGELGRGAHYIQWNPVYTEKKSASFFRRKRLADGATGRRPKCATKYDDAPETNFTMVMKYVAECEGSK